MSPTGFLRPQRVRKSGATLQQERILGKGGKNKQTKTHQPSKATERGWEVPDSSPLLYLNAKRSTQAATSFPRLSVRGTGRCQASQTPITAAGEPEGVRPGPWPFPGHSLAPWVQAGGSGFPQSLDTMPRPHCQSSGYKNNSQGSSFSGFAHSFRRPIAK